MLLEQQKNFKQEQLLALNTLQHTATLCTHYNILRRTATHCNTTQHTATHRNTLQHAATRCTTHTSISHSRRASHGNMRAVGTAAKLQTRTASSSITAAAAAGGFGCGCGAPYTFSSTPSQAGLASG